MSKLLHDLNKISQATTRVLTDLNAHASSIKESEGRAQQTGATYSFNEARGLPEMNSHRIKTFIEEMELKGRQLERDETKVTKPYQLNTDDIREAYKAFLPSFSEKYQRPARVIAGLNLKGGVGKTTLIANLASGLVRSRNMMQHQLRVLLIDLDPQGSASLAFGLSSISQNDESAIQAILKQVDATTLKSWIRPTRASGLDVLPAFTSDAFFSVGAGSFAHQHGKKLTQLLDEYVINPLRAEYDVILLDCGPHLDSTLLNALTVADAMLIPVGVDPLEFDSSLKFLARLNELFELIEKPILTKDKIKIVATKIDYTNNKHLDHLNVLNHLYPEMVLNKTMQYLRPFAQVLATQETIYEVPAKLYQGSAASFKKALFDFDGLVAEIFSTLIIAE